MRLAPVYLCLLTLSAPLVGQAAQDNTSIQLDLGKLSVSFDDNEYKWWQNNCLNIRTDNIKLQHDCAPYEKKYREHYNRSLQSGNNPGKGHDKGKNDKKAKH